MVILVHGQKEKKTKKKKAALHKLRFVIVGLASILCIIPNFRLHNNYNTSYYHYYYYYYATTSSTTEGRQLSQQSQSQPYSANRGRRRRRLEFVHIPKTGGTTIEGLAALHNINWGICHFLPEASFPIMHRYNKTVHCRSESPKKHQQQQQQRYMWTKYHRCPLWHIPSIYYDTMITSNTTTATTASNAMLYQNPYNNVIGNDDDASVTTPVDRFVVVRNPYDRLISEYYYYWVTTQKKPLENINNENRLNRFLTGILHPIYQQYYYSNENDKNDTSLSSSAAAVAAGAHNDANKNGQQQQQQQLHERYYYYDDYNIYDTAMTAPTGRRPYYIELRTSPAYFIYSGHYIPQYDYVYVNRHYYDDDGNGDDGNDNHPSVNTTISTTTTTTTYQYVQHIIKFENMTEEFNYLMSLYNLTVRMPKTTKSKSNSTSSDSSTSSSSHHLYKGPASSSSSALKKLTAHNISRQNRHYINTIYKNDFEFFGYTLM